MMYENYSVLMSVYKKEKPEYLRLAVESMLSQTVKTDDFVLVCDGPLTKELDAVIGAFENREGERFHPVRLEKNQGLGKALGIGIFHCKNELIARMDSDDIAVLNRCEWQLDIFRSRPDISLCGGYISEFNSAIGDAKGSSVRKVPCSHDDILKFARLRNPMNHMTVMFKKSAVLEAGNYLEVSLYEDYYLWVRMLLKQYKACNIDKILVHARAGEQMYRRRGGFPYIKKMIVIEKKFLELGFISRYRFILNCVTRAVASLLPNAARKILYKNRLREKETM